MVVVDSSDVYRVLSSFPPSAQRYVTAKIPKYDQDCQTVTKYLIVAAILWILVCPLLFSKKIPNEETQKGAGRVNGSRRRSKQAHDYKSPARSEQPSASPDEVPAERSVSIWVNFLCCGALLISAVMLVLCSSPYNEYLSRRVFLAPLLTPDECDYIVQMAHRAAARNVELVRAQQESSKNGTDVANTTYSPSLLKEPAGWQKDRHTSYPTTDLNLVTDPFTAEDHAWLQEHVLDSKVAPQLSHIFGIPASSIRANDLFIVRYDATKQQSKQNTTGKRPFLANHTDDSMISINILLNRPNVDFVGGGTRYWDRAGERNTTTGMPYTTPPAPFGHVQPSQGQVVLNNAMVHHEGVTVTEGTRYIMVGFLNVDHIHPLSKKVSGLSLYASWLNVNWLFVTLKHGWKSTQARQWSMIQAQQNTQETTDDHSTAPTEAPELKWTDNKYIHSLFLDCMNAVQMIGDMLYPHKVERLVTARGKENQKQVEQAYIEALEEHYHQAQRFEKHYGSNLPKADWFKGQQLSVDIDGSYGEWFTRSQNRKKFDEL